MATRKTTAKTPSRPAKQPGGKPALVKAVKAGVEHAPIVTGVTVLKAGKPMTVKVKSDAVGQAMALFTELPKGDADVFARSILDQLTTPKTVTVSRELRNRITKILVESARRRDDPLKEARERGENYMHQVLSDPQMLTIDAAADLVGLSRTTINDWRNKGKLLALSVPGSGKGFRYPSWQFAPEIREHIETIIRGFVSTSEASPWKIFRFLTLPDPLLGGRVALDLLRQGDIEPVLRAAKVIGEGRQGAH